jgi:hypothetical protein
LSCRQPDFRWSTGLVCCLGEVLALVRPEIVST